MKRAGYTVVELLVVIVVSAFLTTTMIAYSSKSRSMLAVMADKTTLVQVLQRARSMALSTYSNPNPHCAVGVMMDYDTNTYVLQEYNIAGCAITDPSSPSVTRTTVQEYVVNPQVKLVAQGGQSLRYVLFFPPDPTIKMWGTAPASIPQGAITLGSKTGSEDLSSVLVYENGLINF